MNGESIILGYSGHAFVVLDILYANGINCTSYCDREAKQTNPYNLEYVGNESDPEVLDYLKHYDVYIGIGDNKLRAKIFDQLILNEINTPYISHPSAVISPTAILQEATIVMPGAVINAVSNIGKGVICNTSSIIEHECTVGDFSHVAPGAILAGGVSLGNYSFVGANSVIKQGVKIGDRVTIGAGAVILKNVPDDSIIYGNPAKLINNGTDNNNSGSRR